MNSTNMGHAIKAILGLVIFLLASSVFADELGRFTPAETDLSMRALKDIIGDWTNPGSASSVTPLLQGAMMTFNTGVLVFATAIFAYAAIVGTLQSAHDGQLLGKQWSTVWVPIRFTAGIAMLIPTASGLCMAQMGMLWVLSNGIGLASSITADAASSYVARMGNVVSVRMTNSKDVENATMAVLSNELCVAAFNRQRPGNYGISVRHADGSVNIPADSAYFSASNSPVGARIQWGQLPGKDGGEAPNICGEAIAARYVMNRDDLTEVAQYGQANGILAQSGTLRSLAEKALSYDGDSMSFVQKSEIHLAVDKAAKEYISMMSSMMASAISGKTSEWTNGILNTVNNGGWFTLGTWYFQLGRLNGQMNEIANGIPPVQPFEDDNISNPTSALQGVDSSDLVTIKSVQNEARNYFADRPLETNKLISGESVSTGGSMSGSMIDNITNAIFSSGEGTHEGDIALSFGYDPANTSPAIVQLKNVGDWIITGVYTAAGISFFGDKILNMLPAKKASDMFSNLIGGSKVGSVSAAATSIFSFTVLALLVFGIILAFWLPMLPFVNWIGGLVGWVISVLEMLVAVPVWIAAHLHPEGEGMASRYAASGYMIILELLLRPVLMVFGFIVAVLIVDPMLNIISWMYFPAFASSTADSSSGLITLVMKIIIYTVICWMVVNFSFKAITTVPSGVMKWIGGMAGQNSDMAESMGENTRQIVVAGTHQVQGGVRAGMAKTARAANKSMGGSASDK